jgi:hypothetical protein
MTAISTHVIVECPPWCSVVQRQHLRELHWDGRTTHWSDTRKGEGWEIRHTSSTTADGTPGEAPRVYVSTTEGLSLAGAEALALTLLATYEEASD